MIVGLEDGLDKCQGLVHNKDYAHEMILVFGSHRYKSRACIQLDNYNAAFLHGSQCSVTDGLAFPIRWVFQHRKDWPANLKSMPDLLHDLQLESGAAEANIAIRKDGSDGIWVKVFDKQQRPVGSVVSGMTIA